MTTQGCSGTRAVVSEHIAFRVSHHVGTLENISFAAQWLACTSPCQRFADILTGVCA
jgi:hypothetical protein